MKCCHGIIMVSPPKSYLAYMASPELIAAEPPMNPLLIPPLATNMADLLGVSRDCTKVRMSCRRCPSQSIWPHFPSEFPAHSLHLHQYIRQLKCSHILIPFTTLSSTRSPGIQSCQTVPWMSLQADLSPAASIGTLPPL